MAVKEFPTVKDNGTVGTIESYLEKASGNNTVRVRGNYQLNTIRRNVAEALGIPAASIVLVKPNGEPSKDYVQETKVAGNEPNQGNISLKGSETLDRFSA